ncbi:3151_t:CDS:1, partial [Racocetra fulgida]
KLSSTINYNTRDMSIEQIFTSSKSIAELLKDIEAISNRIDYVKINNILASFVEQLNAEYPLLQKDIEDP